MVEEFSHRGNSVQRIDIALKVHFALLAALGGVILGFGEAAGALPLIAIFSALFSLIFIDLLGLFALPSLAAYIGMGFVAAYCISDFVPLDPTNNRQLTAVAQLLVLVQAVLMLQKKTRRVFEQIGVFCMLELVVAAVFNNALIYAALLIPISLLGLSALVLLQVATAIEPAMGASADAPGLPARGVFRWKTRESDGNIRTAAPDSVTSLAGAGRHLPRLALLVAGFPVLLVAGIFFYALPRTAESDSSSLGITPVVGYSDKLELNQIGHLQQSATPVMRVELTEASTGRPYPVAGSLYLRGTALENYDLKSGSGRWRAGSNRSRRFGRTMPRQFHPKRASDKLFYDEVDVEITIQPQSTSTLFAVAPYHSVGSDKLIAHETGSWMIHRRGSGVDIMYPRMSYRLGTHAFVNGSQTHLIRQFTADELRDRHSGDFSETHSLPEKTSSSSPPTDPRLLRFDEQRLPTIKSISDAVVAEMPAAQQTPHQIASRLSHYLRFEADLEYTLDLTMERDANLDPIEQFIRHDRRGHCQYFAATLAMMLRSQGIPARLVVGYKSDEFSPFGKHYIIRQLHAHAWVEALLQEDELQEDDLLYGQPESGPVWMRLDPTPSGENSMAIRSAPIAHRLDYLQSLWERYVLDMDAKQQDDSVLDAKAIGGSHGTYTKMIEWFKETLEEVRANGWGGDALAERPSFSWPAALLGILGTLAVLALYRVGLPRPVSLFRRRTDPGRRAYQPRIPFFARTCEQLKRVGAERRPAETASEFTRLAGGRLTQVVAPESVASPPAPLEPSQRGAIDDALAAITDAYYRVRFGGEDARDVEDERVRQAVCDVERAVEQRLADHDRDRPIE